MRRAQHPNVALRAWHRSTGKGSADHSLYRDRRSSLRVVYLSEVDYQDWLAYQEEYAA
jgi:hypothetical protein